MTEIEPLIIEDPDGDTEMTEVDDRKHEDTVLEAMTKSGLLILKLVL